MLAKRVGAVLLAGSLLAFAVFVSPVAVPTSRTSAKYPTEAVSPLAQDAPMRAANATPFGHTWGTGLPESAFGVAGDGFDGVYVAGTQTSFWQTPGTGFLLRWNAAGGLIWAKNVSAWVQDVAAAPGGDAFVLAAPSSGSWAQPPLVARVAPDGSLEWALQVGGDLFSPQWGHLYRLTTDPVTGGFFITAALNGVPCGGGVVAAFRADGTPRWARFVCSMYVDVHPMAMEPVGLAADGSGNVYVTFWQGWDYMNVAKLGADGSLLAQTSYECCNRTASLAAQDIAVSPDGTVSVIARGSQTVLIRLNQSLGPESAWTIESSGFRSGVTRLVPLPDGSVLGLGSAMSVANNTYGSLVYRINVVPSLTNATFYATPGANATPMVWNGALIGGTLALAGTAMGMPQYAPQAIPTVVTALGGVWSPGPFQWDVWNLSLSHPALTLTDAVGQVDNGSLRNGTLAWYGSVSPPGAAESNGGPPSSPSNGLSLPEVLAVVGTIALVYVVGLVLVVRSRRKKNPPPGQPPAS